METDKEIYNQTYNYKPNKFKRFLSNIILVSFSFIFGFLGVVVGHYYTGNNNDIVVYKNPNNVEVLNKTSGLSIQEISASNLSSVVEIITETEQSFFNSFIQTGAGSGVIISNDGYILTNSHVIENANNITVRLANKEEYIATLVGNDLKTDIAVIKIETNDLKPVIIGDSDNLNIGDIVVAIGNPLGQLGGSVTDGIISGINREVILDNYAMNLIQTNAQVNKGNSGGGLFDANGNLIGIVVAKSADVSVEGIGFAIPIVDAMVVAEQIIEHGYVVNRPQLGIYIEEVPIGSSFKSGVYISGIIDDSAASHSDLEIGDRIVAVDDIEVSTSIDLSSYLDTKNVDDIIIITVVREERLIKIEVQLKAYSKPA